MKCHKFKKLIPDFLEGQLNPKKHKEVFGHLMICKDCSKEKEVYEKSWQLIGNWQDIQPEAGFKMRFWNRVVALEQAKVAPQVNFRGILPRWSVALATAVIIIVALSIALPNYFQTKRIDSLASRISSEDIVLVENIDLLENLDVIQEIEFLEDMELIENLDKLELESA